MNETKMRSAEPSSVPGQPDPIEVAPDQSTPPGQPAVAPNIETRSVPPILFEGDESIPGPDRGPTAAETAASSPPEPAGAASPSSPLPSNYGTGKLLLVARDPGSLYAHWDLPAEQALDQPLQLRIHHENLGGPVLSERPVDPKSNHCFIPIDPGGIRYIAELGYHSGQGGWTAIAASQPVAALAEPGGSPAPVTFGTLLFAPSGTLSPG